MHIWTVVYWGWMRNQGRVLVPAQLPPQLSTPSPIYTDSPTYTDPPGISRNVKVTYRPVGELRGGFICLKFHFFVFWNFCPRARGSSLVIPSAPFPQTTIQAVCPRPMRTPSTRSRLQRTCRISICWCCPSPPRHVAWLLLSWMGYTIRLWYGNNITLCWGTISVCDVDTT